MYTMTKLVAIVSSKHVLPLCRHHQVSAADLPLVQPERSWVNLHLLKSVETEKKGTP